MRGLSLAALFWAAYFSLLVAKQKSCSPVIELPEVQAVLLLQQYETNN